MNIYLYRPVVGVAPPPSPGPTGLQGWRPSRSPAAEDDEPAATLSTGFGLKASR